MSFGKRSWRTPLWGRDVPHVPQIDSAPHRRGPSTPAGNGLLKRKPFNSWAVHFTGQQDIKWALDEDLRWARRVLDGDLRLTSSLAKPYRARGMVAQRLASRNRRLEKPESRLLF